MNIVCELKKKNEDNVFYRYNVDNKIRFWFYVTKFESKPNPFILDIRTEILMDDYNFFEFCIDVDDHTGLYKSTTFVAPSFVGSVKEAKDFVKKINELSNLCVEVDSFFKTARFSFDEE